MEAGISNNLTSSGFSDLLQTLKLLLARTILASQHMLIGFLEQLTRRPIKPNAKTKCILILRTSALGDFIFAIPAMAALRERFPNAKIVLLTASTTSSTQRSAAQSYAGPTSLPWLDFMVPSVVDEAICFHSLHFKGLRSRIRELNPDITVILGHPGNPGLGLLKKIVFLRLVGVSNHIYGWRTRATNKWLRKVQYDAGLFEHHVMDPLRSISELPCMPVAEDTEIKFPLFIDPTARAWVEDLWRSEGYIGKRVVAVAPGSIQPHKRWPIEQFIKLSQELVRRFNVKIIIIGTQNDSQLGTQLVEALSDETLNLASKTSLSQSAALLEKCNLLVGNDGGAMHLGSAMGCPVVSIVPGLEYPNSVEPWFSRGYAVRHAVPCAPCYSFTHCPQGHNKCMVELPLLRVLENCASVLNLADSQPNRFDAVMSSA